MKKTLSFILVMTMIFSMISVFSVQTAAAAVNWKFSEESGELTIFGSGKMPDFDKAEDAPWDYLRWEINSIVIEHGVTHIGNNSFYMFSSLHDVTLPESLNSIGAHAFEKCWELEFVDMPNSVTEIGGYAFSDCYKLGRVAIGLNTSKLRLIGDGAFSICTSLNGMNIPKTVTYIGDEAFRGCTSYKNIKLPDRLEYIGKGAFESCTSLKEIDIPWQIKELPDFAFFGCSSLEKVTTGKYFEKIGRETFMWCDKLDILVFPAGLSDVGKNAFGYYYLDGKYIPYKNAKLSSPGGDAVKFYAEANGIRFLKYDLSYDCPYSCPVCGKCTVKCDQYICLDACKGHDFPVSGKCGESAVWTLSNKGELKISGFGEMTDFDFRGAPWEDYGSFIKSVSVEGTVQSVGSHAFEDFENLRTVKFSGAVKEVHSKAFFGCTNLESVSFGEGLEIIGTYAFGRCTELKKIKLDACSSLKEIAKSAFTGCSSLDTLTLPSGIESIGAYAFENCASLKHIDVPASLISVGTRAVGFEFTSDRRYVKTEDFYISGDASSDALRYCNVYGIRFERTDTHVCKDKCKVCGRCTNISCRYPECADKCDLICSLDWDNPYNDVRSDEWYFEAVKYATVKGLFNGTGEGIFAPDETVTRAQAVTALWRLSGESEPESESPFEDLSADWYRDAVEWAYENEIVNGESETLFMPNEYLTREQLAAILMRYRRMTDGGYIMNGAPLDAFPDSSEVSDYARTAMSWAFGDGLIAGNDIGGVNYLSPKSGATRAQLATIFMRMIRYR